MSTDIISLPPDKAPGLLAHIPQPPRKIYYQGTLPPPELKLLSVVGSRRYSGYGKAVVSHLINGLRGYPVGIVSGLALGIDSLAHQAALDNELYTLAIPGSGLDDTVLYPARHRALARSIISAGGGLLSEFPSKQSAAPWTFPQRNRLVVGISDATLVIEAGERSGSLISARLAVEYNRELLVVPGDIFSQNSAGNHQFLKLGAHPVTAARDILEVLCLDILAANRTPQNLTPVETTILSALAEPCSLDTLAHKTDLPVTQLAPVLMEMELKDLVHESDGLYRAVV